MKAVYRFHYDTMRFGQLDGLFVAEKSDYERHKDSTVWYHDELGKHSEAEIEISEYVEMVSDNPEFVAMFEREVGEDVGLNPLERAAMELDELA